MQNNALISSWYSNSGPANFRRSSSSLPLSKTAWSPFAELPSVITANDTFFCLRIDLIQPDTVVTWSAVGGLSRSCLIVGARENFEAEAAVVEANRRRIMIDAREEQTRRLTRQRVYTATSNNGFGNRARPVGPISPFRLCMYLV